MTKLVKILALALGLSLLAAGLSTIVSSPAAGAGAAPVNITQVSVPSVPVSVGNTPSVNVANTPTVNLAAGSSVNVRIPRTLAVIQSRSPHWMPLNRLRTPVPARSMDLAVRCAAFMPLRRGSGS
jgi:hypothetical protein